MRYFLLRKFLCGVVDGILWDANFIMKLILQTTSFVQNLLKQVTKSAVMAAECELEKKKQFKVLNDIS